MKNFHSSCVYDRQNYQHELHHIVVTIEKDRVKNININSVCKRKLVNITSHGSELVVSLQERHFVLVLTLSLTDFFSFLCEFEKLESFSECQLKREHHFIFFSCKKGQHGCNHQKCISNSLYFCPIFSFRRLSPMN